MNNLKQNISEHGGPWYEKPNQSAGIPGETDTFIAQRIQKIAFGEFISKYSKKQANCLRRGKGCRWSANCGIIKF